MSNVSVPAIRSVAYYRKSDEDDGASVEQQKEWANGAVPKERLHIVREFTDQSKAGWKTSRRTQLHAMLAFCQAEAQAGRPIDAIVCWHPDRFSRADSQETDWFLWEFRKAGTGRMFTATHGWRDFERATDRMVSAIEQEAGAHAYVKGLAQNVTRGRLKAAREGRYMNGAAPFGYVSVPRPGGGKRLALADDVTVKWARWIFTRFLEPDGSLDGVARELTAAGVPTPRGKAKWTPRTVRLILSRETYLGRLSWGQNVTGKFAGVIGFEVKERDRGRGGEHVEKPKEDWIEHDGTHEPLVDPATFERVQAKLAKMSRGQRTPRYTFPLTGLVYCGHCCTRMHGSTTHRHLKGGTTYYHRYLCQTYGDHKGCHFNSVKADVLLDAVVRRLQETVFSEANVRKAADAIRRQDRQALAAAPGQADGLRRRVEAAEGKVRLAERRFADEEDQTLLPALRQRVYDLRREYAALAEELSAVERARQPSAGADLDALAEEAIQAGLRLAEAVKGGSVMTVRELILAAVEKVELFFRHEPSRQGKRTRVAFARGLIHIRPDFPLLGTRYNDEWQYDVPNNGIVVIHPSDVLDSAA